MLRRIIIPTLFACNMTTAATSASATGLPAGPTGVPQYIGGLEEGEGKAREEVLSAAASTSTPSSYSRTGEEVLPTSSHDSVPPGCTFILVRHGQSRPNISGKIVSGIEVGSDPANGLTEEGRIQARDAGEKLKDLLLGAGCLPANTLVLTSPFSRARETAEAISECLECELREERDLRERWFGDLDGQEDSKYEEVWALDAASALHATFGVEPACEVAARTTAVVRRARREVWVRQRYHTGEGQPFPPGPSAVVVVSHGDALQLLLCSLSETPLEEHRSLPHLENCGIRALHPLPGGGDSGQAAEKWAEGVGEWEQPQDAGRGSVGSSADKEVMPPSSILENARVLRPGAQGRDAGDTGTMDTQ